MLLEFITIILICCLCVTLHLLNKKRSIPYTLEHKVTDVLAHVDDIECSEEVEGEAFFEKRYSRGAFQAKVIKVAKAEFGYLKRSEANRLMVRKYMRDLMRDRGMRPSHIAHHVDICVAIFFIPSRVDMEAHQIGAARDAHERNSVMITAWESFFGPLGSMLGFPSS
jgi:hypothetical protein